MDEVKTEEPQAAKDAKAEADWKAEADRKADDDELKKSMGEVIRKLDTAKTPEEQKDALAAAKTCSSRRTRRSTRGRPPRSTWPFTRRSSPRP